MSHPSQAGTCLKSAQRAAEKVDDPAIETASLLIRARIG
jgi:hypothetical protein